MTGRGRQSSPAEFVWVGGLCRRWRRVWAWDFETSTGTQLWGAHAVE